MKHSAELVRLNASKCISCKVAREAHLNGPRAIVDHAAEEVKVGQRDYLSTLGAFDLARTRDSVPGDLGIALWAASVCHIARRCQELGDFGAELEQCKLLLSVLVQVTDLQLRWRHTCAQVSHHLLLSVHL